jgi:hypothetical protein
VTDASRHAVDQRSVSIGLERPLRAEGDDENSRVRNAARACRTALCHMDTPRQDPESERCDSSPRVCAA